jgi:biopolymer transport protein ExbD
MPVHVPGPRLFKFSVKLKHISAVVHAHNRPSNIALNLTPFVDMMTILVTFLLMVFSASGEILRAPQGLEMPTAAQQAKLQQAPIIMVTETTISVLIQDPDSAMPLMKDLAVVQSLLDSPPATLKIDALFELLKSTYDSIHNDVESANDKHIAKAELEACTREQEGLPPIVDNLGHVKHWCPDGLAIVQADKKTDARIISMIVNTARQAGFDKLLFAIKFSGEGPR